MTRILAAAVVAAFLAAGAVTPRPGSSTRSADLALGHGLERGVPCRPGPCPLARLAAEAEAIVVADVVASRCRPADGGRMVWTDAELAVSECWKGALSGTACVSEPGGVLPPLAVLVGTAPRYEPGTAVVAFLTRDALGNRRTLAGRGGLIALSKAEGGARVAVVNDEDGRLRVLPLGELRREVARQVAHQGAAGGEH